MASSEGDVSLLRKYKESLAKASYPEAVNNPEEWEKIIQDILSDLDGYIFHANCYVSLVIEDVKSFKPRKGDILIVDHPRSG